MTATGWMGEGPDGGPALPVTEMLLGHREHRAGMLETALARSRADDARQAREAAGQALDPDEHAANLVSRGYMPGMVSQLALRLADVTAELEAERGKLDKGEKRAVRVRGMLERGQIGAMDASAMLDGDFGDAHRAEQLERQCDRLRREIADAATAAAPPRPPQLDPLEAASRHAHDVFTEVTRERMAEAATRAPQRASRRPFAAGAVRSEAVRSEHCVWCTQEGLDDDTSYLLHSDPEYAVPVTSPQQAEQAARRSEDPYREIAR